ncbi:MAG: helix-turn-helix transcriptional regulator [Snodgrassella sp.]|uniref:helix-turn-helix transcriptional regulator n=1 Tax=Snodgrassella sp. TaxID=2815304 RepID=UPI002585C356|nr:helix-turn-helix transcriptional regulator [Snodgrassella sp.]MCO6514808.1 helix-turn-helix transcriptional regulator [Snodgrassella sp.]MCO6520875.1 helix-turn-helix transcriptional regulator [Snodgrassella sp.]
MDNSFKDRLTSLFPNDKISTIALTIGMSSVGLSKIFSKGTLPKAETLIKINEITGCDLRWLMTGTGKPYPDSNQAKQTIAVESKNLTNLPAIYNVLGRPVDIDEFVFIPYYEVKAAAGSGYYNSDENNTSVLAFRKYWIKNNLRADPKHLSVITVKGDSMEGVLNDGDNILVNHANNKPGSGLYVIRIGEDLIVKRVQSLPGGRLLITSANEAYAPFEVDISSPASDVSIIGRVEWFGRYI